MPWTAWKADPTADSAARDVLAAYDASLRKASLRWNVIVQLSRSGFVLTRIKSVPMPRGRR